MDGEIQTMKNNYLASTYQITVDGLPIGEISYPFECILKPKTLVELREEIARRAKIRIDGIKIRYVSKAINWGGMSKVKARRIKHRGKVS